MVRVLVLAASLLLTSLSTVNCFEGSQCGCLGKQTNGDNTFWIDFDFAPGADADYRCGVYDHNCNPIGDSSYTFDHQCDPGLSLTSQLPYTLEIKERGGTGTGPNGIYAKVDYAGRRYQVAYRKDCSGSLIGRSTGYFTFPSRP